MSIQRQRRETQGLEGRLIAKPEIVAWFNYCYLHSGWLTEARGGGEEKEKRRRKNSARDNKIIKKFAPSTSLHDHQRQSLLQMSHTSFHLHLIWFRFHCVSCSGWQMRIAAEGTRVSKHLIFLRSVVCWRFFKEKKCIRANLEFMLTVDTQKIVSFLPLFLVVWGTSYFRILLLIVIRCRNLLMRGFAA